MKTAAFLLFFLICTNIISAASEITVAQDGSGDVSTVNAAIERVPTGNSKRFVIRIKRGIYREQVVVPSDKPYVSFIGEARENTKISFDINNSRAGTTSAAYAVYIGGHDFHAQNITFENSFDFPANKGKAGLQAVAVLVDADRIIFENSAFLGWQDTLYAKNGRQFYKGCYVEGGVDFIFGRATAVFENCEIHSKTDGYITAPMRFSDDEASGFVFRNSKLTASDEVKSVFLGRPWRAFGRSVFIETEMGTHINPAGWNNWGNTENEKTAYFAEISSSGAGANEKARVNWARKISVQELDGFSTKAFLRGTDQWDPYSNCDCARSKSDFWEPLKWKEVLDQSPEWYQTDEAARIADQVVLFQKSNGGWEKNLDMAQMLSEKEKTAIANSKDDISETTIDNQTTYSQLRYLAMVISASLKKKTPPNSLTQYREAFDKGLDYLFSAQYPNGGFPQFFPLRKGYYTHITFNDDAMIGVLKLLREISKGTENFEFVSEDNRAKANAATELAEPLILKTQIIVKGKRTIWAAQYDEKTLEPAPARRFEPVALASAESVGVVKYLMLDSRPSQEKIEAIESAIKWFSENKILGFRWERENGERNLVKDEKASPIWARFYEIPSMKPIFLGRDGVVRYDVGEIELERRNGYAWYVDSPNQLLEKDYPKWKKKIQAQMEKQTE